MAHEIVKANTPQYTFTEAAFKEAPLSQKGEIVFEVSDLSEAYDQATAYVLAPDTLDAVAVKNSVAKAKSKDCYLRLPRILRNEEIKVFERVLSEVPLLGVYTDNLYGVALARKLKRKYIVGFGLNVFNEKTASIFEDASLIAASVEANAHGNLYFRAGKVALMSFAHCPFSVAYGIDCASCPDKSKLYYENADGRYLILRRKSASCDFTMYEDKVTVYPKQYGVKNLYYRFIGLNEEEKRDMMKVVSEDISEQKR